MADLVREAFETWGKSKYLYLEPANERQTEQGRSYYTEQSENMWLAFQAGAALATPPATPVQPTASVEAVAETQRVLRASEDLLVKTFGDPSDDPLTNKVAERLIKRIRELTGGEHV